MIYDLPEQVTISGMDYKIHSDFRCILDIMEVLNDADLTNQERVFLALGFFYPKVKEIPQEHMQEAAEKMYWFIRGGSEERAQKNSPKLMDWEKDFQYIIGPVNRIVGHEIRNDENFHWWSFLAAYMDIGESLFSQIVRIRQLKAKGKKLDKADAEWYRENRDLVDIPVKYTQAEKDLLAAWGGKAGGG